MHRDGTDSRLREIDGAGGRMAEMYDVIAVTLKAPHTVRVIARNADEQHAEALIKLVTYWRDIDAKFYTKTPSGKYNNGDEYRP